MSAPPTTVGVPGRDAARSRRASARLIVGIVLGAVVLGGAAYGTLASFTASTTNSGTFATGALVLSDKVNGGTTCLSIGNDAVTDTNANAGCASLLTVDTAAPGDAATSATIVLQNVGNVDAQNLHAYASAPCASDDATSTSFHGTAGLCGLVQMTIQSYTSQANLDANDPTGGVCMYGVDGDLNGVCDGFSSTKTLASFSSDFPSFSSPLPLGIIGTSAQRFYRFAVRLDPTAGNLAQGRRATFGITWRMVQ